MKDIDFDELDRAVNSLISPDKATSAVEPSVTATAAVEQPQVSSSASSADDLHAPVSPPLARRRSSGRFMDVVHPSSDMRTSPAPTGPAVHAEMMITPPSSLNPTPEPATSPDVVEASTPGADDASSPLESPFLSDAKVEKRPLGAFSTETVQPASTSTLQETPKSEILDGKSEKSDSPIGSDTPLPAELQDDLLSIEANEDTELNKNDNISSAPEAEPVVPVTPSETASAPIQATSITTQYTEQPSTSDQPTGTVFNTDAYKKPIARPKKKSGWLIVLWIFLLLVVGAGVGAAIYFFVLPKL